MAVPSYTEDLTDLTTAESSTNWVELTGTITLTLGSEAFNAQGTPAGADGDYPFIQGSFSVTQDCTKSTAVGSLAYNNAAGTGGHGTDGAYFVWQNYMVASNIQTYANDGFMLCVGSGLGDYDVWVVGGVDKAPYPYGGWVNHVVNTTVTADYTAGTPTATEQYIGAAVFVNTGSQKGEVHNVDVIRYGRGSAIFEFGQAADYADLAGFAALNDASTARWGLIQETAGGYLWKGRMQLGTVTNAVDFRDSNQNVFIQWTPKVTANFNLIECINTASNVEMTNFSFTCLDTTTASQGRFLMTDQCDVNVDGTTWVDMDTFVYDKGGTKTVTGIGGTYRRCALVTLGLADLSGSLFDSSTVAADEGAVFDDRTTTAATNISELDNCTFVQGTNAHHAIRFGTGVDDDITLTGIEFTGFDSTADANGATLRFDATSGSMNVNLVDCTVDGNPATTANVGVDDAAGITVTLVVDPKTTKFTVQNAAGTVIENARVLAETADNGGGSGFPYQAAVTTLTQTTGTATLTSTAPHGLDTNDYVVVRGAQPDGYNKQAQITVTGASTFTYSVDSGLSSPATGTPVFSYAPISGLTNASGVIQSSKTWPASQGLKGWARKSTSSPYYKQTGITVADASGGTDATVTLQLDE
jgi:hypothetical protein